MSAKTVIDEELERQTDFVNQQTRSISLGKLYSVCGTGYEGENIKEFLKKLQKHNIKQLADIREIPNSRKPGFSKNRLIAALVPLGIKYAHYKLLGSPKKIRHELRQEKNYNVFFKHYEVYLDTQIEEMKNLEDFILQEKTVLLCFEVDHSKCHRTSVLTKLQNQGYKIEHI